MNLSTTSKTCKPALLNSQRYNLKTRLRGFCQRPSSSLLFHTDLRSDKKFWVVLFLGRHYLQIHTKFAVDLYIKRCIEGFKFKNNLYKKDFLYSSEQQIIFKRKVCVGLYPCSENRSFGDQRSTAVDFIPRCVARQKMYTLFFFIRTSSFSFEAERS